MGAKAPAKLKLRRPTYKCDICDRKMLSAQALKTHKYCIHKINEDVEERSTPVRTYPAKAKITKSPVIKSTKQVVPVSNEDLYENSKTKVSDVRRIEFECPECKRAFASYFSAFRHIKKYHCPKSDGTKARQPIKLPMPVRLEICVKCNQRIGSDIHVCHEAISTVTSEAMAVTTYMCTGCNQKFLSIQLFDLHVAGLHTDDGVESMFFPQMNEFLTWKEHMETKLNIRYLVLGKCTSKQTFHCTYLNTADTAPEGNEAHICPSSIVVQEFSKGIQVHYYKKHFGHPCPKYTLSEDYKKYSITSLMIQTPEHYKNITNVVSDENDLYIQFKTLMESIVVDSAKIKIDSLKVLLGKALEMTSILTTYDEEDETISVPNDKSLTDEQISSALEKFRSKKRKNDSPVNKEIVKKAKATNNVFASPKTVQPLSATETNGVNKAVEKPKDDNSKLIKKPIKIDTPPSFNDSYKDFVDKNFIKPDENKANPAPHRTVQTRNTGPVRAGPELRRSRAEKEEIPKEAPIKPKEVPVRSKEIPTITKDFSIKIQESPIKMKEIPVKTKEVPIMTKELKIKLQETPSKTKEIPIKTKEIPAKPKEIPVKTKGIAAKTKEVPIKTKETPIKTKEVPAKTKEVLSKTKQVPVKTKESGKIAQKPKKTIVKTKMGQFKPSLSPKKSELNKSIEKLKVDFDYEVKEQENDCNILILKI